MPTELELLAICLKWIEHPQGDAFDKAMLTAAIRAKLKPPQRREWVGLTEDEIVQIGVATGLNRVAVGMIEAKLKEKNT
jgi:hypothetical protein